ncbi:hypothetical protein TNCV_2937551 [Trichonephila clavipes]|nr:hypothetical protein TNCV_2937551 [Trichonephila clavipes]
MQDIHNPVPVSEHSKAQRIENMSPSDTGGSPSSNTVPLEDKPPSPSILDIILDGDISLPVVPLTATDLETSTEPASKGNTVPRAKKQPSFAQMAQRGANKRPSVTKLLPCNKCGLKFYTQHGLRSHSASCTTTALKENENKSERRETARNAEERKGSEKTGKQVGTGAKRKTNQSGGRGTANKRKPIKPTFCRHCNHSIFLSLTLENHYLLKHHRRLSPQNDGQPASTNKPATVPPCDAGKKEISRKAQDQIAQRTKSTTPANTAKAGKLPARRLIKNFRCDF